MNFTSAEVVARQHGAMEYSEAPTDAAGARVDLDEVRRWRLGRVRAELVKRDLAAALLFDPINCRYACDATNMQIWTMHYETRCVFVAAEGPMILFDYGWYPHLVEGLDLIDEYRVNKSFYYFAAGSRSGERAGEFAAEVADLVVRYGGGNMRLAVDRLSHMGCAELMKRGVSLHDGLCVMEEARVIKSAGELALMGEAIRVCEAALGRMRAQAKPGISENELWSHLHQANIEMGGEWIETRLLSSGARTFPWFRESSMKKIRAGEMISVDTDLIGPYGYCADMSRSWVCGEGRPTDAQRYIYGQAYEQIQHNKGLLKAGVSLREVSERAWKMPAEFDEHRYGVVMHGIGLADEYPAVKHLCDWEEVGYDMVLAAGMTLCVESYIGSQKSGEGVKLEEQVLICEDGIKQLTTAPLETEWL